MTKLTLIFISSIIIMFGALYLSIRVSSGGRYYDCRMADFHPDYPPKVKEECRKLLKKQAITV